MEKPVTKAQLLQDIQAGRKRLEALLRTFSFDDMVRSDSPGEWSIQDILAHIAAWEETFINWYEAGRRGEKIVMPDWSKPGILDEINLDIYRRNRNRGLKEVLKEFKDSYKKMVKTVKSIPEEIMFTPGKVTWTGKDSLADYVIANTSRHYAEHIPMIEDIRKKLGK